MKENSYFSRQLALPQIGPDEQNSLRRAKVAIVGVGGLGCPATMALAGSGIGTVILIDGDTIEQSNLHRQWLFNPEDCGQFKALVAQQKLAVQFPFSNFVAHTNYISGENIEELLQEAELILDCTDSIEVKYLLDAYCGAARKPLVYAAMHQFQGYLSVFHDYSKDVVFSYQDVFPFITGDEQLQTCEIAGVMTIMPQLLGTYQAIEAVKLLIRKGKSVHGRLLIIDALNFEITATKIKSKRSRDITTKLPEEMYILSKIKKIQAQELSEIIDQPELLLIDIREEAELKMGSIPNSMHIPYAELTNRLIQGWPELLEKKIVVYCNRGIRSSFAAEKILQFYQEIDVVYTLHGGINSWAQSVDPNIYSY